MTANRLQLGEFVLDRAAGELLTVDGQLAGLRKQALDVLVVLGHRAGQVVSKDELMRLVWPNVVVGEGSLTQAIADIRRVLGDSEHRLIRNVARRGYMLAPDAMPAAAIERSEVASTPATLAPAALPPDAPPLSIIVLPLAIEGEAKEMEWFADALHGDLVIEVARLHNSMVIARETAATYKGKVVDPRQVAREMGVRHVVSGSLRREGRKALLNLELIVGETGVLQWAETFSIDRARLHQTLGDFAVAVERTLAGELFRSTVQRRSVLAANEVSADDLAMQGYAFWYRGVSRENVLEALALCERAVEMDPDSARAWAGINFTSINILLNSWTADRAAATRRIDEASTQLERLDRDGHYTQQAIALRYLLKRDFPAMLRHTTTWIERYRLPVAFGAHALALNFNGRFDEAVLASQRALRLGPRDPYRAEWQYGLALAHFGAGSYELAKEWSETAAATNAALHWPPIHAAALHRLGELDAAQRAFDEHMSRHPNFTASQLRSRLASDEPALAEARERLVASLRQLGMHD